MAEARSKPLQRADWIIITAALWALAWSFVGATTDPLQAGIVTLLLAVAGSLSSLTREARLCAWIGAGAAVQQLWQLPPIWPLAQLVLVLPAGLAIWISPDLRAARGWVTRGRVQALPVVLIAGVSVVALPAWVYFTGPDLSATDAFMPNWPMPALVLALLGFSIANAALEELLFRGLLQGALRSAFGGKGWEAIVIQAALFGLFHLHGFPSGPIGVALAGSWALLLGWARERSDGLMTPLLAHVVADMVIFAVILSARLAG